jgi:hypothetical protein
VKSSKAKAPELVENRGAARLFIEKNKANLFRIEYCVLRIAKRNLKKQSQFVAGQIDVTFLQKRDYENRPRPGLRGN